MKGPPGWWQQFKKSHLFFRIWRRRVCVVVKRHTDVTEVDLAGLEQQQREPVHRCGVRLLKEAEAIAPL